MGKEDQKDRRMKTLTHYRGGVHWFPVVRLMVNRYPEYEIVNLTY